VAFVRGRAHVKRAGHAGTLDPFAEGVLPVCLGQATRVIEYLMDARKTYRAVMRLGRETDTYDLTGAVICEADASGVTRERFEEALKAYEGESEQRPPAFSAIKRDGVPLYRLARAGEVVEPAPRPVRIYRIEATRFELPLATFEVECGKGTYVRSLAHDIGRDLGVGGSLESLVRTKVGPFDISRAVDIETLRSEFESGAWRERLIALDEVLLHLPAAIAGHDNERRVRNGLVPRFEDARETEAPRLRVYTTAGDFLAIMRREGDAWRPDKVFAGA
jgi:tRNA pseudouridine55 synthase